MAVTRTAAQSPAPQVSTTFRKLSDAYATNGGMAPASHNFSRGMIEEARMAHNENALRGDISVLCPSSPIHAIWQGLGLTFVSSGTGSGGFVTVAAGQARIDGIVELSAASSANAVLEGVNFIYLTSTKVIQVVTGGVLTPPASIASCFLGAILVTAGVGTVDTSGVVYAQGISGSYRETADAGAPGDTPPLGAALDTKTAGGWFVSEGSSAGYNRVDIPTATGATASVAGTGGLLPAPPAGTVTDYLGRDLTYKSLPTVPDASTTVKGVTKLSVAPVSATNPIAVGDNDPRNTNARTPTAHTHAASDINSGTFDPARLPLATTAAYGATRLSVAPATANTPIAVGDNDPRLMPFQLLGRYTTATAPTGTIAVTGPGIYEIVCSASGDIVTLTFAAPSTLPANLDRIPITILKDDGATPLGSTRVRIQSTGGATVARSSSKDITVDQGSMTIIPRIAQNDYAITSKTA